MDEDKFINMIKPFVKIEVDSENPQLKTYVFKHNPNNKIIRLDKGATYTPRVDKNGYPKKVLRTPNGTFETVAEAALSHGVSIAAIYNRIKTKREYYFEE